MKKLNIYDFDGTIYNGDSSIDFLIYSIKNKKSLLKYFPKILLFMILNRLGIVSIKEFKQVYFSFIKEIKNLNQFVEDFWKVKNKKINKFFFENIKKEKNIYVISASPEFLLKPYLSKFENIKLIATQINKDGILIGENCKSEEKLLRLKKVEKDFVIENFYTDSLVDLPLIRQAQNSFYVHKGMVEKLDINKIMNSKL